MLNELIGKMEHLMALLEGVLEKGKEGEAVLPGSDLYSSIEEAILEAKKMI